MFADLRLALRALRRAPGFALAAVLCLALGIGAAAAVLALADAVLFRPLSAPGLARMVVVRQDVRGLGVAGEPLGAPAADDLLARRDLFDAGAAFETRDGNLTADAAEPLRVRTARTQGEFFGLMGARPAAGRLYAADASRGGGAPRIAVLGYAFWREHYGGDPAVVGRTIRLNDVTREIVGVAGPALRYPRGTDLYLPSPMDSDFQSPRQWSRWTMTAIGRVRPGVTTERLRAGLAEQAARWQVRFGRAQGADGDGVVLRATPFVDDLAGQLRPVTRVLLAAVALVLLVACANVACLQLVRATGRARELAVRAAVGAGRGHLVRPLAAESAVLAGAGGTLGIALAAGTAAALRRWHPAQYPQLGDVRVDPAVLAGALAASAAAALAFGLAPALRAMRADPQDALRASARGASAGADRHRFLRAAVATQVALALTLTLGAGLLGRSFARLAAVDPGFRPDRVLTAEFVLPFATYPGGGRREGALARVLERVQGAPEVDAAALSTFLPFADGTDSSPFTIAGRPPTAEGAQPHADYNLVSEDYFRTMGIALKRGRTLTRGDDANAPPVVVIDEQLARAYFPGEDPVGRHLNQPGDAEIVGVVASVARADLGERRTALIYTPLRRSAGAVGRAVLTVRSTLPPAALAGLVRRAVADVDRQVPVYGVRTMADRVDESVGARRLAAWALGGFAGAALVLAALGLSGVLSYVVAQRTRELGVRAALGAGRGDLERMVVGGGARLAGAGALAGVVLFLAVRRGLAALLYGVGPADPVALGGGLGVLAAAVLLASWVPARRAARVDPAVALRAE
ncbi:hypothetical protein tb265_41620 [Gemmatimonadetes bacterium T265]|nr:hypothetical protein tb265_41620 [Gemmatimonadetes bacterium T265]